MCCRTVVHPLEIDTALAVLQIGLFKPSYTAAGSEYPTLWERVIGEENSRVTVSLAGQHFEINISPSISAYDQHLGKRITASVYFEISAKYAEKVGGEIIQRATVLGCKDDYQESALVIARYPVMPMSFERVCKGFQHVLLNHGLDAA
jgi:hypothetical protein